MALRRATTAYLLVLLAAVAVQAAMMTTTVTLSRQVYLSAGPTTPFPITYTIVRTAEVSANGTVTTVTTLLKKVQWCQLVGLKFNGITAGGLSTIRDDNNVVGFGVIVSPTISIYNYTGPSYVPVTVQIVCSNPTFTVMTPTVLTLTFSTATTTVITLTETVTSTFIYQVVTVTTLTDGSRWYALVATSEVVPVIKTRIVTSIIQAGATLLRTVAVPITVLSYTTLTALRELTLMLTLTNGTKTFYMLTPGKIGTLMMKVIPNTLVTTTTSVPVPALLGLAAALLGSRRARRKSH